MKAMRRRASASQARGATVGWFALGGEEAPARTETTQRLWFDRRQDRERAEWTGATEHTFVRDGNKTWTWFPQHGTDFREDDASTSSPGWQQDAFLDPSLMLPAVDLEAIGPDLVFGRQAITVRAVPRTHDLRHGIFAHHVDGLDEIMIAVDAEHGVLLRETGYLDGGVVYVEEVTEISFDEQFDDEFFVFVASDGEPAHPRDRPRPEPLSVEEAQRKASFTVVVPGRLPQGWEIDASYIAETNRPPKGDRAWITARSPDGQSRLQLTEGAEPPHPMSEGERVEIGGLIIMLWPGPIGGGWIGVTEFGGTHVHAQGNLERDAFVEILANLRPADPQLPPMTER